MGMSTLKKQIKDFILTECHQEKVGVASIERFNSAPKGMHPTDFLPGCKSVIMFCTRLPDGAVNAALRTYEDRNFDVHGQYGMFGYVGVPNYNLLWASYKAARYIEKNSDAVAMPMTIGPTHGAPMLSMRHCAVAAGLGQFGWCSIVLTPEFGPRNRFGGVLTTLELEPDPMMSGERLCDYKRCHICDQVCPTGAIPPYKPGQERVVDFGEGQIERYAGINWTKCKLACEGSYKDFNYSGDYNEMDPIMENPIDEEFAPTQRFRTKAENVYHNFIQHQTSWKCGNCLQYCPVGNWKERFHDTGVSSVNINEYIDDCPDVDMDTYNGYFGEGEKK